MKDGLIAACHAEHDLPSACLAQHLLLIQEATQSNEHPGS